MCQAIYKVTQNHLVCIGLDWEPKEEKYMPDKNSYDQVELRGN